MGFRHSPLLRDLELYRFGFSYIEPLVQQARGVPRRNLRGACTRIWTGAVRRSPVSPSATPRRSASCTTSKRWHAPAVHLARVQRAAAARAAARPPVRPAGQGIPLARPARPVQRRAQAFDDDRIRTLFTSYMHVITTESVPGAGIVFPLIFANVMEFTLPVGGSQVSPLALRRVHRGVRRRGRDRRRREGDRRQERPRRRGAARQRRTIEGTQVRRQRDRCAGHHADGGRGAVSRGRAQEARTPGTGAITAW